MSEQEDRGQGSGLLDIVRPTTLLVLAFFLLNLLFVVTHSRLMRWIPLDLSSFGGWGVGWWIAEVGVVVGAYLCRGLTLREVLGALGSRVRRAYQTAATEDEPLSLKAELIGTILVAGGVGWVVSLLPFQGAPATGWLLCLLFLFALPILAVRGERYLGLRSKLFALLNVGGSFLVFFHEREQGVAKFCFYLAILVGHWLLVRFYNRRENEGVIGYRLVFWTPLVILVGAKAAGAFQSDWALLGISYMAFRMSYLALELEGEETRIPFWDYLAFMLFVPTLSIGPISPYQYFSSSFAQPAFSRHNVVHGIGRILVGYVKFKFLGNFLIGMGFQALWNDGFQHGVRDFLVSSVAYYLYIYANFSGWCDMVVGSSAILGIRVKENFASPLLAPNLQEFWSRWHISFSEWMRDVVFLPLSVALVRRMSVRWATLCSALAATVTFVLVGLWHGFLLGYLLFGIAHGIALALRYYYVAKLKAYLTLNYGERAYARYTEHWGVRASSIFVTFTFIAVTMFFFENAALAQMQQVLSAFSYGW